MAAAVAKSGLFGMKTPEQALALMLVAQAEGLHPATAARDYHVIQGRPALRTDAMLARFQSAGGKVEWNVYTDKEVAATFSHAQGGSIQISWTMDMAARAGLAGKDNWKNYPRAMLRARVISEGIRTVFPGAVVGVYSPEEVQDMEVIPASAPPVKAKVLEQVEQQEAAVADAAFPIFVPGQDAPYSGYDEVSHWIAAYRELAAKIARSAKIPDEVKAQKLAALREVNQSTIDSLSVVDRAEFMAATIPEGA